jgi:cytidylate kinase
LILSIAVDGPAGAGKSTIAKIISEKFNLMYINTGAMYRAVTLFALRGNIKSADINGLCSLIDSLEMHFDKNKLIVNGEDVSELIVIPDISKKVSEYAAVKEVRDYMLKIQQDMAQKFNVIMDGRDIGTVVLKDAFIKFFINASAEERARRRFSELKEKGIAVDYNEILNDIVKRDYYDSHRDINPLKKAEDAIEIDTSFLSIKEVVEKMSEYIYNKMRKNNLMVD